MINVLIAIHVLVAVAIIGLVLVQHGKGADAGAAFGGGGGGASGSLFGSRGSANFLSRTTAILATVFFLTSLSLTYLYSKSAQPTSVTDRVVEEPAQPASDNVDTLPLVPVETIQTEDVPALPGVEGSSPADTSVETGGMDVPAVPTEKSE